MRSDFNALIKPLRPVSIENALTYINGLPDVAHVYGWAELKTISKWPVREKTPLRIDHFTDEQKNWSREWVAAGGSYRLVVKVDGEWFVFKVPESLEVGTLTRQQMSEKAILHSKTKPARDELIRSLKD